MRGCYSTAEVVGYDRVGGLIGHMYGDSTIISGSYATGNVSGDYRVGGLVGYMYGASAISKCYATGNVSGKEFLGGLAGYMFETTAENSYATGNVNGDASIGGLAGWFSTASVTACYAKGDVSGTGANVGGLIGRSKADSSISNSYAMGNVTGGSYADGFVGNISETISENNYATGSANGVAADLNDKENFDRSVLDSTLWDLSGDNPTLKSSIWSDCGKIETNKVSIRMQVGDTADETSSIKYDSYMRLNLDDLDLSTVESARNALAKLQSNITDVTAKQSYIGTQINRLSDIYNSQQIRIENVSAAKSTISDTDYAKEVANMVKSQILQQISISVLTQSQNISGKIVLSLL